MKVKQIEEAYQTGNKYFYFPIHFIRGSESMKQDIIFGACYPPLGDICKVQLKESLYYDYPVCEINKRSIRVSLFKACPERIVIVNPKAPTTRNFYIESKYYEYLCETQQEAEDKYIDYLNVKSEEEAREWAKQELQEPYTEYKYAYECVYLNPEYNYLKKTIFSNENVAIKDIIAIDSQSNYYGFAVCQVEAKCNLSGYTKQKFKQQFSFKKRNFNRNILFNITKNLIVDKSNIKEAPSGSYTVDPILLNYVQRCNDLEHLVVEQALEINKLKENK